LSGAFIELLVAKPLYISWWILSLGGWHCFKPSHIQFKGKLSTELKLAFLPIYAYTPLVHAPITCSPLFPSLESSLVKPMDNDMMINLIDDLGLMDIEIKQVEGRINEFYRSLGSHKQFESLLVMPRGLA